MLDKLNFMDLSAIFWTADSNVVKLPLIQRMCASIEDSQDRKPYSQVSKVLTRLTQDTKMQRFYAS